MRARQAAPWLLRVRSLERETCFGVEVNEVLSTSYDLRELSKQNTQYVHVIVNSEFWAIDPYRMINDGMGHSPFFTFWTDSDIWSKVCIRPLRHSHIGFFGPPVPLVKSPCHPVTFTHMFRGICTFTKAWQRSKLGIMHCISISKGSNVVCHESWVPSSYCVLHGWFAKSLLSVSVCTVRSNQTHENLACPW